MKSDDEELKHLSPGIVHYYNSIPLMKQPMCILLWYVIVACTKQTTKLIRIVCFNKIIIPLVLGYYVLNYYYGLLAGDARRASHTSFLQPN